MKLIHKTARYVLLVTLPIVLASVFLLYFLIHQVINKEIDELLISELKQVQENLNRHPPDKRGILNWDHNLQIAQVKTYSLQPPVFTDTTLFDPIENQKISVRMLRTTYAVGKNYYSIRLHQPYLEFKEIAQFLSIGIGLCFIVLLVILLFVETLIFQRVLQPFYNIIHQLKQYRVDQESATVFSKSDVDEFRLLSESLTEMIQRAAYHFSRQKQFTDNTSHELQTPLSILSTDLDLLQQSPWLSEGDLQRIHRSQRTIKRLASMNQALLLLTKIDNRQFIDVEPININNLISELIDNFRDYADSKNMTFVRFDKQKHIFSINRHLAFILFSNLIKNAIRHGRPDSSIVILSSAQSYTIINEGKPLPFPKEEIFHRFVRNNAIPYALGLGLAIVEEIADQFKLRIEYDYSALNHQHIFTITFK